MVLFDFKQLSNAIYEVSSSLTLDTAKCFSLLKCTNTSAITISIPTDANLGFTTNAANNNAKFEIFLEGGGDVVIQGVVSSGVTILKTGNASTTQTLSGIGNYYQIIQTDDNEWRVLDGNGGDPSSAIATHNTATDAHSDIRTLISSHAGNTSNPHSTTAEQVGAIPLVEKGANSGVATLNSSGKIPDTQIPTNLKSSTYALGSDLQILPVAGGQSGVSSFWGLQIGGLRGDVVNQGPPSYALTDPGTISNIESNSSFCVGIAPGNTNLGDLYNTNFNLLAIYKSSWQTGGNFLSAKDNSFNEKFAIAIDGKVKINGTQVLSDRDTGWSAGSGTASKGSFNTSTASTADCAQRILALEQALRAHGLIN